MKRAKAFYKALLAIALEPAKMEGMDMWTFRMDEDKSGATGALIKHEMRSPHLQGTLVYFEVQNAGSARNGLRQKICLFTCLKQILVSMGLLP